MGWDYLLLSPRRSGKEELLNLDIHFQPWQLELFKQIST